jgi:cell division protein FtsW (lipid II flippase)
VSSLTLPPAAAPDQPGQSLDDQAAAAGRRRSELTMIAFAVGVVAFAFINVGLSMKGQNPGTFIAYILIFALIALGAHLAVWRWAPYADPLLVPLAILLNGLGVMFIYRLQEVGIKGNAGTAISTLNANSATMQFVYTVIGIGLFAAFLVFIKEPRVLQRYTYLFGFIGLFLFALPALLPDSISEVPGTGAKVQVSIPGLGSIQPEEFAKIFLAVSFAGYLVLKRDVLSLASKRVLGIDLPRGRDMGAILAMWVISMLLLVFESDIGTSAVFMGLFVAMIYIATGRKSWLLIGFGMFVGGAVIAGALIPHVGERFSVWLHPFSTNNLITTGLSYQPVQGLYGMANGGVLGRGLGAGMPYLTPLVQSDMVFTGFGEEIGLTGVMALLLVYGLIIQRGLHTALLIKDPFSKLLAGGLSFMLAIQVFVIVGGVTRLIPLAGIPMPWLSQGGSSLIASWVVIGILVRLSDTARRPTPKPIQDEGLTQVVSLK